MLIAALKSKNQGVTLIELIVGIAIISIITSIAVPSFQSMLLSSQIRNAAESVANGLQKARGEAVARNTNVTFVLGAAAAGSFSSWTVNIVNPASTLASRNSSEGSNNVTRTVLPAAATTVTFNNLGGIVVNADGSNTLTQIDFSAVGSNRNMRITIGGGGNTKMCDPNLASGSSPRAC